MGTNWKDFILNNNIINNTFLMTLMPMSEVHFIYIYKNFMNQKWKITYKLSTNSEKLKAIEHQWNKIKTRRTKLSRIKLLENEVK